MEAHVLNGDALAQKFPLTGEIIICRECLIDGPVQAENDDLFWNQRATFITDSFDAAQAQYFSDVKGEFERLPKLTEGTATHLWFEHDLFCQANLWFTIDYAHRHNHRLPLYIVMPPPQMADVWSGFGMMDADELLKCYRARVKLTVRDIDLAASLWQAYRLDDRDMLKELCRTRSAAFPFLEAICEAHLERSPEGGNRPRKRLKEILRSGYTDFDQVFSRFRETEGIYGFGDLQVRNMLATL